MNAVAGTRRSMKEQSPAAKRAKRKWYEANKARVRQITKEWEAANPEWRNAWARKYKAKHSERINARRRELYAADPAPHRARATAYREANPGHNAANDEQRRLDGYFATWKKLNKDKVNSYTRNRRARLRGAAGQHTAEDVKHLLIASRGLCYWCRREFGASFEVDHVWPVVLGGENHVGNLCLSCPTCNKAKGGKTPAEFAGVLL